MSYLAFLPLNSQLTSLSLFTYSSFLSSFAQDKYKREYGSDAPELELDTAHYLSPPPKAGTNGHIDDEFESWWVLAMGAG